MAVTVNGIKAAGGVPVDNTLSKRGAAADAKATGDAINSLSSEITTLKASTKSLTLTLENDSTVLMKVYVSEVK